MVSMNLEQVRDGLEDVVERLERGETIEIERSGKPRLRLAAEVAHERIYKPIDVAAFERCAAMSKPYVDPDGLSFVERMRQEDRL